jgi:hypothetical protein
MNEAPIGSDPDMPGVDLCTPTTAVVLCNRTVVPLTEWLSEVLIACSPTGRELQLVTAPTSRLTLPLVQVVRDAGYTWVVHDRERGEYYDGLTGVPMSWQDDAFYRRVDPSGPKVAEGFAGPPPPDGRQLRLRFEIQHAADSWTMLGGAFEAACRALTGQPPAGWGTAEPVDQPWQTADITAFARDHVPTHCWLIAVGASTDGRSLIGTIEATRVDTGVLETVDLCIGYPASTQPPLAALPELVESLAHRYTMTFLYAETRLARHDLTRPAYGEGLPLPVGLAVGPAGQKWLPADDSSGVRFGPPHRATTWYALSQGDSLLGWDRLADVLAHLPGLPGREYPDATPAEGAPHGLQAVVTRLENVINQRDQAVKTAMAAFGASGVSDRYRDQEARWTNAAKEVRDVIALVKTTLAADDAPSVTAVPDVAPR